MEKIRELFLHPTNEYRTAPLWVWNADMTEEEIEKALTELQSHGFGGAFVHPRPGMKLTYLDDPFFAAWKKALETAKKLGLKLNIYDENSYPSGFGGGHVSAELPDCLSSAVQFQILDMHELHVEEEADTGWLNTSDCVVAWACEKKGEQLRFIEDITNIPRHQWKEKGEQVCLIIPMDPKTAGWLAGFADVDRLRPEVTECFLEKVHGQYASHFGEDFGDTIQAVFTDEPSLQGSCIYGLGAENTLPVNYWFLYEFQKRKGYSLTEYLPCLFIDVEGFENERIRYDYYEVTHELWTENFLKPIQRWCHDHAVRFTGHFMEDGWPKPFFSVVATDVMSNYEYEDWPGIDLLMTHRLLDVPCENQEISMLEVMSAGHQLGKERIFCEAFGAGGYDSGLADYKRIGDYLFVNGVTFINEHLTYTSYVGARKRDHPQSFDWRQPWWEEYTVLNEYFARLCAVLSQGRPQERILVVNPTMTGVIQPRNGDITNLCEGRFAKHPDMTPFVQMIHKMRAMQLDINLGDEILMKRHGRVRKESASLEIGRQQYTIVVLHELETNMMANTIALLEEFLLGGGRILSVGRAGRFVEGVEKPEAYESIYRHPNCHVFSDEDAMLDFLEKQYDRYLLPDAPLPVGVESIHRILEDGSELVFIANHSKKDIHTRVYFHGASAEEWNPWDGSVKVRTDSDTDGERISIFLDLPDGQSKLFCIKKAAEDTKSCLQESESLLYGPEIFQRIYTDQENVFPVEYCDLTMDKKAWKQISTIRACETVYKHRGFMVNPWDNVVQFKDHTYKRNAAYDERSGFSVSYHFWVAEGYRPDNLKLAVEYGDRYEITVNGTAVRMPAGEYFMDPLIRLYSIAHCIVDGENTVTLTAPRFDVELEVEPIMLKGNFGVFCREDRWILGPETALARGSILEQGYPFYVGGICYEGKIKPERKNGQRVLLCLPETEATAVSVWIGHRMAGVAHIDGNQPTDITPYLVDGENTVTVRVCTSMKNLLGPHFNTGKKRRMAWPGMWKNGPVDREPKSGEYDLIPYGM